MSERFLHVTHENVRYLKVPAFEKAGGIRHAFSTREGGVSRGIFASMNLGPSCGDDPKNVIRNYVLFCRAVGIDPRNIVFSKQVHESNLVKITKEHKGNGFLRENMFTSADGLITDQEGVALVTFYADCVPVLLYDPKKRVIASVHSGWRGTALKISSRAVLMMQKDYGCKRENILAAIGPCIGPCCYEVGEDVKQGFDKTFMDDTGRFFAPKGENKYMLDLWSANRHILLESGIKKENITLAGECTACNSACYFSHRASKGKRGSMIAVMELIS